MAAKKELLLASFGGGQPNISQDIIKKLRVPVPPLEEQNAIILSLKRSATLLTTLSLPKRKNCLSSRTETKPYYQCSDRQDKSKLTHKA